ncbi:hypothetical protein DERP_003432 [Dermatophagoides pteronyssinus]|uniref:Uncharacterized protein n=1 Tax=Dermatophagoides pteronyssinus TaxID=6956 RepID=A0ABQ8JJI5_DERPT|nr:hypothetical protein DERP_003432 [Dermatophagoides pteronyssinus]
MKVFFCDIMTKNKNYKKGFYWMAKQSIKSKTKISKQLIYASIKSNLFLQTMSRNKFDLWTILMKCIHGSYHSNNK